MARDRRERHFVWPIIIIGIGLVLLLQNFGIIDWSLWELLGRYWPVILVLIGLDMLLARSYSWLAGAVAAAAVLAFLAAGWYTGGNAPSPTAMARPTKHVVQELQDQQSYEVRVQFGARDAGAWSPRPGVEQPYGRGRLIEQRQRHQFEFAL